MSFFFEFVNYYTYIVNHTLYLIILKTFLKEGDICFHPCDINIQFQAGTLKTPLYIGVVKSY